MDLIELMAKRRETRKKTLSALKTINTLINSALIAGDLDKVDLLREHSKKLEMNYTKPRSAFCALLSTHIDVVL